MDNQTTFERFYFRIKHNRLLWYFTVFNRVILALAFLPSGFKKFAGHRFTSLPISDPVGFYFEAFYRTGFYYNFIGAMQLLAALLLLIPRTATLGALMYFPIVLNICILTISMHFTGTWVITSLMLLANLYLLCWDYDRLQFVFPFRKLKIT